MANPEPVTEHNTPEWIRKKRAETQAKVDSGELQFENWDEVKVELGDEFDRKWRSYAPQKPKPEITSKHDYEIWEIIWATRFDLEHTSDPGEQERYKGMIEYEMSELEPEAITWWNLDLPER
jgi:hypothetical protein